MSDGSSGLSLSEMGISTVKKTAQAIKKQANPFMQGVKQQVTGQGQAVNQQKPQSPTQDSPLSGVFDIVADTKKQITGFNATQQSQAQQMPQQQGAAFYPGKTAQPPSESGPVSAAGSQAMSGSFDLKSLAGDQTLFEKGQSSNQSQNSQNQKQTAPTSSNPFATIKGEEEKKLEIESLRKKLHDAYYEQFEKKVEGKGQKEETVQERLEREEQEKKQKVLQMEQEEEKKKPIIPLSVQGRQGAHEGLKQKG